ncbi:MAG: hypothetical protein ACLS29_08855 [Prevotellamassilia sp.]
MTRGLAIKNQKVLDVLEDMVRDCRRKCNEVDVNMMTADEVVELVTRAKPKRFDLDIIAYGWEQVRKVTEEGRQSTAHKYAIALRSLQRFLGQDGLSRGRAKSGRTESGRAESGRVEPGRAEQGRTGTERTESGRTGKGRAECARVVVGAGDALDGVDRADGGHEEGEGRTGGDGALCGLPADDSQPGEAGV